MADVIDQTDDREAIMESLRAKARASFKPRHSVECVECGDVIPEERQRASLGGQYRYLCTLLKYYRNKTEGV